MKTERSFLLLLQVFLLLSSCTSNKVDQATHKNEQNKILKYSNFEYITLPAVEALTCDEVPANVFVTVELGFNKIDETCKNEINEKREDILNYIKLFYSQKTADELKIGSSYIISNQIKEELNSDILSNYNVGFVLIKNYVVKLNEKN